MMMMNKLLVKQGNSYSYW